MLHKGLQYNLSYSNTRQWLERLVTEIEVTISKLPLHQHEGFRYLAKQSINKIVNKQHNKKSENTIEFNALKSIKQKLIDNGLKTSRSDKGKTLVIMHHENFGVKFSPLMKKITSNA
jgi:hypothetical protein